MKKVFAIILAALMTMNVFSVIIFADENKKTINTYTLSEKPGGFDTVWLDENGKETDVFSNSQKRYSKAKATLPEEYNSAEAGYVTSVKDQGSTGSCWAFSMAAATETSLVSQGIADGGIDLSEAHHVWFTHNSFIPYTETDTASGDGTQAQNPYDYGGNWKRSSFSLSRGSGWAKENDYPYSPQDATLMGDYPESDRYVSSYFSKEVHSIAGDITSIKNAVMKYGSVGVGYYSYNSYYNRGNDGYCYYYPNDGVTSNHQIIIVGWDDNFDLTNFKRYYRPAQNGAWICKNSYGEDWGDNGYFRLSYCDPTITAPFVTKAGKSDFYSRIYQYDGYGYSNAMTASSSSTGKPFTRSAVANIFTASDDEVINYVGFHTAVGVKYTAKVYTGVDSTASSPLNKGELAAECSGSVLDDGYYTVTLDNSAFVRKGEKFAVVLELERDEGAPVMVEGQDGVSDQTFTRHYHSETGQSYFSFGNDGVWYQCTSKYNNVCVKAFAKKAEPVEISSAKELCDFAAEVNGGESFLSRQIKLTADIDMKDISFTSIGTASHPFMGTFDGQKHIIKNLTVSGNDNTGFFGYLGSKATLNNLGIVNCDISGRQYTGALAGYCTGERIFQCFAQGKVSGTDYCGGLFGYCAAVQVKGCFAMCDVNSVENGGSFTGVSNSKYENCYTLSGINAAGSGVCIGVYPASAQQFENGYVPYMMNGVSETVWTKSQDMPGYYQNENDRVFRVNMYDTDTDETFYIYVKATESVKKILEGMFPKNEANVFTDYLCKKPFEDSVKYDRTLYMKLTKLELTPVENADIEIANGLISGIGEGYTVSQLKSQFSNENIVIKKYNGTLADDNDTVTTGFRICLLNSSGETADEKEAVIFGDLNRDGWIDAFDVSVMCAYIAYEIDDSTLTAGETAAFDVDHSGWGDECDLVLLDLASIFYCEIDQKQHSEK